MASFSFSLFNIASLTAALRIMDLLSFARSTATAVITHHSRQAATRRRRPSPQTLCRITTTALRILLFFTLPLTLTILLLIRASQLLRPAQKPHPSAHTILLTVSPTTPTPTVLSLARALHAAGHTVILARTGPHPLLPTPARFSASIARRIRLASRPHDDDVDAAALYEHEILGAILRFRPALWIPCEAFGSSPSAFDAAGALRDDLQRGTGALRLRCGVVAPGGVVAGCVGDRAAFGEVVAGLRCGVGVAGAGAVVVRRRGEVHAVVHAGRREGKRVWAVEREGRAVLLDGGQLNEVYERVARLDVSEERPWAMREVVEGEGYTAHVVVVSGGLRAFAVASAEAGGRRFLEATAPLHGSVLSFVEAFVAALPDDTCAPLAIDFTVQTRATETGTTSRIHPTRCSWDVLPISIPPFSTAMAELVEASYQALSSTPPPSSPPTNHSNGAPPSPKDVHTPPSSPTLKPVNRFTTSSAALLPTPPSSPSRSRCSGSPRPSLRQHIPQDSPTVPREHTDSKHASTPADALLPQSLIGVHSLPRTVLAYVLLPLLALLPWPSRKVLVDVVQGWAVLAERMVLPGAWVEEVWERGDAGPWVWEWGVLKVGRG